MTTFMVIFKFCCVDKKSFFSAAMCFRMIHISDKYLKQQLTTYLKYFCINKPIRVRISIYWNYLINLKDDKGLKIRWFIKNVVIKSEKNEHFYFENAKRKIKGRFHDKKHKPENYLQQIVD